MYRWYMYVQKVDYREIIKVHGNYVLRVNIVKGGWGGGW